MVKHGLTVLRKVTQFLNPGQTPATAFDAPSFALAKLVQWKWPDMHGEEDPRANGTWLSKLTE